MLTKEEEMFLDEIEQDRNADRVSDAAQLYWFLDTDDIRGLSNMMREIGGF